MTRTPDPEHEPIGLPADLVGRLDEALAGRDETAEDVVETLVEDYLRMRRSIDTYVETAERAGTRTPDVDRLMEVPPPVGNLLGFSLDGVDPGRAALSFAAGPEHANPMGTLHGGILCDVGDAAMGIAFASTLDDDETFTTLELDIKYLKPVWTGRLQAVGEVVKRGRSTGLVECDITDAEGSLVARLNSVCLTLRGEAAEGR